MRLDQYLKLSRLVPRRGAARDLCDAGAVDVNGARAKPGRPVRPGDQLAVRLPSREVEVEVLEVPAARSVARARARTLYRVLAERRLDIWGNVLER